MFLVCFRDACFSEPPSGLFVLYLDAQAQNVCRVFTSAYFINSWDLEGTDVFSCSQHKKNIHGAAEKAANEEGKTKAVR